MSIGHAEMAAPAPRRRVRLLSLDGGGIRGVSMITILKEIMRQVNQGRPGHEQLQPWQLFDLIGGTSTGGIIAIMLGCLRMTLDECEEAYKTLAQEIFRPKRSRMNPLRMIEYCQASERFDSQAMSKLLKDIICRRTGSQNYLLRQSEDMQSSCKVFVTTVRADDQELCLLRSYANPQQTDKVSTKWQLWEALRATSAANTYFDAHINEGVRYVDGALKHNNPVYSVMAEADDLWNTPDSIMLSIGTGEKDPTPIGGNMVDLARTLTKTLVSDADTERFFRRSHRRMAEQGLLYRFNVPRLGHVKLHDYKAIPTVIHNTQRFLADSIVEREVSRCADVMKFASDTTDICAGAQSPLRVMQLSKDEKDCLQSLHAIAGDYESHPTRIEKPVAGTCEWLLKHTNFMEWLDIESSSLLWLSANPGCGKSVLSAFLVESLRQNKPDATICYFAFKNGEHSRNEANQALCALLHRFILDNPKGLKAVLEAFSGRDANLIANNIEKLWQVFLSLVRNTNSKEIIFVIDALDECSESSRNRFIDVLSATFSKAGSTKVTSYAVKVFITSRPWPSIENRFKQVSFLRLRGEEESRILTDIETMVKHKVYELSEQGSISPEAKDLIEEKLLSGADQTFLWVSLVFDKLTQLHSRTFKSIKMALENIPTHLDKLYEKSLSSFQDRDASLKLLRIVVAAQHPLHLDEMNIIMNIDQHTESLDTLRQGLEPNMEYTIKQLGGFFIRIVDSRVQLVHQTAREFLLRSTISPITSLEGAAVHLFDGEQELGGACIRFLTLKDIPKRGALPASREELVALNRQFLQHLPTWSRRFYSYAAMNWGTNPSTYLSIERNKELRDRALLLCKTGDEVFLSWWHFYAMEKYRYWGSKFRHNDPFFAHMTIRRGHLTITKLLLETKSCCHTDKDSFGRDLLCVAAVERSQAHIEWLLKHYPHKEMQCGNALLAAIVFEDKEAMEALVKTGVDLNAKYQFEGEELSPGWRVFHNKDFLLFLLQRGLAITDEQILKAASWGWTESLEILIHNDPRDNAQKKQVMNKAIQEAAYQGTIECYDLILKLVPHLISSRPDISIGIEQAILRWDSDDLSKLLDRGADASNALDIVLKTADVRCARLIFSLRSYPQSKLNESLNAYFEESFGRDLESYAETVMRRALSSKDHSTRLCGAFKVVPSFRESQTTEFIKLFIENGSRISRQQFIRAVSVIIPFDGEFAVFLLDNMNELQDGVLKMQDFLSIACLWGKEDVVEAIIARGAVNINNRDSLGLTPVFAAVTSGNVKVVSLLLRRGARPDETVTCSLSNAEKRESPSSTKFQEALIELLGNRIDESALQLALRLGYADIADLLSATHASADSAKEL